MKWTEVNNIKAGLPTFLLQEHKPLSLKKKTAIYKMYF
jgi:hypothetical protein